MKVGYSSRALADIEEIGDYVAIDSPQSAEELVHALRQRCDDLNSLPMRFPVVFRRAGREIRRRAFGRYLIFYVVEGSRVTIVSILHASREVEKVLFLN